MKAINLVGKWQVKRKVYGLQELVKDHMYGLASFHSISEQELLYQEQLWHKTKSDELFFASKSYRYVFIKQEIQVYFHQEEENRLFMILPISKTMFGTATCKNDQYHLQWNWINQDNFLTYYKVKGPKKDYSIASNFKRLNE